MAERRYIGNQVQTIIGNLNDTDFHVVCVYDGVITNDSPVISSPIFVNMTESQDYNFVENIILDNYIDTEGNIPWLVSIDEIPATGKLFLQTVQILNNTTIPWTSFEDLVWVPPSGRFGLGYSKITMRIRDNGGPLRCYSEPFEILFNILPVNQEPTVSDVEVTIDWNDTLTLLPSFFTQNYYDPEGDSLGHIIITTPIQQSFGYLIFQGNIVNNFQYPLTVTASQLLNGDLKYYDIGTIKRGKQLRILFEVFDDN